MVPENLVLRQMRSNVSASYTNSSIIGKEGVKIFICTIILAFSSFLHDSFYFTLSANALQKVVFSDLHNHIQLKQVIPRLACFKSEEFQLQQKLVGQWNRKKFWWSSPPSGGNEDRFNTTQVLIIWKHNKINWPWTNVGLRKNGLGNRAILIILLEELLVYSTTLFRSVEGSKKIKSEPTMEACDPAFQKNHCFLHAC